jgi:deoxyribodipyrimidine photo-lyase
MTSHAIVWFRQDLRLADNPALHEALKRGYSVIPLYIHTPGEEGKWPPGGATKFWLHQSLKSLSSDLPAAGSKLVLRSAESTLDELQALLEETGAIAVFWNRRYEPSAIERDTKIKETLTKKGIEVHSYNASLLFEPWTIMNKSDKPFRVFTPYWRHCISLAEPPQPLGAPDKIKSPSKFPKSENLDDWELEPKIKWAEGIRAAWTPGERGAQVQVEKLLHDVLENYGEGRNRPDHVGVSRISPHLHFGEIGPRQIWHRVKHEISTKHGARSKEGAQIYLKEIIWREFAYHLLFHFPHTESLPLDEKFLHFPFKRDARA